MRETLLVKEVVIERANDANGMIVGGNPGREFKGHVSQARFVSTFVEVGISESCEREDAFFEGDIAVLVACEIAKPRVQ